MNITHFQINCTISLFILAAVYVCMIFLVSLCVFGVLILKGGGGGGLTLYEIYIGFCPRTDFYDIMHIACLVHGHFISNIDFLLTT